MKYEAVIEHFRSVKAVADALGISDKAVYRWQETGVPRGRAYELQAITRNRLKVDPRVYG